MGDGESAAVITILGKQIDKLGDALETSRSERQRQIESLNTTVKDGLATLHKRVSDSDKRLRVLEISHAANVGRCGGAGWLNDIGGIDGKARRITGLVALALVVLIGVAVIVWGPDMMSAMRGKTPVEKMVTHP